MESCFSHMATQVGACISSTPLLDISINWGQLEQIVINKTPLIMLKILPHQPLCTLLPIA